MGSLFSARSTSIVVLANPLAPAVTGCLPGWQPLMTKVPSLCVLFSRLSEPLTYPTRMKDMCTIAQLLFHRRIAPRKHQARGYIIRMARAAVNGRDHFLGDPV